MGIQQTIFMRTYEEYTERVFAFPFDYNLSIKATGEFVSIIENIREQARAEMIKEIMESIINMEISLSMSYCKNKEQKMMKKAQWEAIKCFKSFIKQLEKEGKKWNVNTNGGQHTIRTEL